MDTLHQPQQDFQLKITSDCITPKSGLVVFFEAARAMGLLSKIDQLFPRPGSNRGIQARDYVMSIVLMFLGGGRFMEDIRQIKDDNGLLKLCGIRRVPSPDAIALWLREEDNLNRLLRIMEYLNAEIIKHSETEEFTLDVDATLTESKKGDAPMNYEGFHGFSALLGYLPELDLCVVDDYRTGNVSPQTGIKEQLIYTHKLFKKLRKKLRYFRSDSAAYQAAIFNECFRRGIAFTITADQDIAVKAIIAAIPAEDWQPLHDRHGVKTDREYATTVHTMNKTEESFTLIVQRCQGKQTSLFDEYKYRYYVIATNDYERDAQELIHFHNQKGSSENYHKELKSGFGLEYTPTQELAANAAYFRLGVIAYNLSVAVKRFVLKGDWIKKTITTLRWQLIFIAGKVVTHARQLFLNLSRRSFKLLLPLREAIPLICSPPAT